MLVLPSHNGDLVSRARKIAAAQSEADREWLRQEARQYVRGWLASIDHEIAALKAARLRFEAFAEEAGL